MMRRPSSPRQFGFLMPLGFIAMHFAMAGVLMWLWNYALVAVSPLRAVNYWQALSILVICRILFGTRPRPRHHHRHHHRMKEERMHRLRERMSQMTDEERRHFKERLRRRFGRHPHPNGPPFEEEEKKAE